jgi:hypothetical protein
MVGGHVTVDGTRFQHWWVVTDGGIVDPMVRARFAAPGVRYEPVPDADPAFAIAGPNRTRGNPARTCNANGNGTPHHRTPRPRVSANYMRVVWVTAPVVGYGLSPGPVVVSWRTDPP